MLQLRRVRYFNEVLKDSIDDRLITYGEYYYYDPEDDLIISAAHYWELKKKKMEDEWDDSYYRAMESERDYKERLKRAEQEYNEGTVLNRIRLEDLR